MSPTRLAQTLSGSPRLIFRHPFSQSRPDKSWRNFTAWLFICLSMVLAIAPAFAQNTQFRTSKKPPPGFEDLAEPQETVVDLYLAGQFLDGFDIIYTPDSIQFLNPQAVVDAVPEIRDKAVVADALSKELPPNAHLLCGPLNKGDCGRLEPEIVGVIFDLDNFRADFFINPFFLEVRSPDLLKFLPDSDADYSILQNISGAFSQTDSEARVFNFNGITNLSHKEKNLRISNSISKDETDNSGKLIISEIVGQQDKKGIELKAGMFRTRSASPIGSEDVLGLGAGYSRDTRLDLQQGFGSQLQVFLPVASEVQLLKDGRIVSTKFYPAGNQIIDTSGLPDGAYNVTLKIRENTGRTREVERFYSKSAEIPPAGEPVWSVEAGLLRDQGQQDVGVPAFTTQPMLRAASRWRLRDTLALGAGITASPGDPFVDFESFYQTRLLKYRQSFVFGTEGVFGLSGNMTLQAQPFSGNVGFTMVDGTPQRSTNAFTPLPAPFKQANLNLSYDLRGIDLGFRANWRESDSNDESWSFGPDIRVSLLTRPPYRIEFVGNSTMSQDETLTRFGIEFSFLDARTNASVNLGGSYDQSRRPTTSSEDGFDPIVEGNASHQFGDPQGHEFGVNTSFRGEGDERQLQLGGDYESQYGKIDVNSLFNRNDNSSSRTLSSNFDMNVVSNGRFIAIGGRERREAAIVVDIRGEPEGAPFDILVNQTVNSRSAVGKTVVIPVNTFQTHTVSIAASGRELLSYPEEIHELTLYPGNVVHLTWDVAQVIVIFGKLLDPGGAPIMNGYITNSADGNVPIERGGFFQTEFTGLPETIDVTIRGDGNCRAALPKKVEKISGFIVLEDDLTCVPEG